MNKFTQKLLIAFAFSAVLLLGGANSSFAVNCKYRVHNQSGSTVKVVVRYADKYQQTILKEILKLRNKRQIVLDGMRIKSSVTVVDPGNGYVRFKLLQVQAQSCYEWVATKQTRAKFYRYSFVNNKPIKGQMTITCKKGHKYAGRCE